MKPSVAGVCGTVSTMFVGKYQRFEEMAMNQEQIA
jgi:hypothetical protein